VPIGLTDYVKPKNDAFVGIAQASQILGGGGHGTLPDACLAASNVTQHEGAITHDNLSGFGTDNHHAKLHAGDHVDATDPIRDATAGQKGLATAAHITKLDGIEAGANQYVHPHHSGDVVSVNDGVTTIQADVVTYAKMQNVAANNRILGNIAGADLPVAELTGAQVGGLISVNDLSDVAGLTAVTGESGSGSSLVKATNPTLVTPNIASFINAQHSHATPALGGRLTAIFALNDDPVMPGEGAMRVPDGTTGERPGVPGNGDLRYNTTTAKFEAYEAGAWANVIGGGAGDVVGPGSSTDNALVRFHEATGKVIQGYTSGAPTASDTGEITISGDRKVFFLDSAIYVHSPVDGAILVNADGSVRVGIGGAEKARVNSNGQFLVGHDDSVDPFGASAIVDARRDGTAVFALVGYGNSGSTNARSQYRKARGSLAVPLEVDTDDVLMALEVRGYSGSTWPNHASIKAVATNDSANTEWQFHTGSTLVNRLTIKDDGTLYIATAAAKLIFNNDTDFFVRGLTSEGMIINCPTSLQVRLKVNTATQFYVGLAYVGFGAPGSQDGGINWTGGRVDYEDGSGNILMSTAAASKWSVFGVTPVTRPDVSGSWAGNAAGAALSAALATLGIITDSTT
jgi:hypothetical protein